MQEFRVEGNRQDRREHKDESHSRESGNPDAEIYMFERFKTIEELLGEKLVIDRSIAIKSCRLPAAFADWACVRNAHHILHRYSNTDQFWFSADEDDYVETEHGMIILFSRESQGNFELGILASNDQEDPPVMYSDYRRVRWTEYSKTFTDALFVQFFDWQYRLVFDADYGAEIDHTELFEIDFNSDMFDKLRDHFVEHPSTRWFWETDQDGIDWRFSTPTGERILLTFNPENETNNKYSIEVMAPLENRIERCKHIRRNIEELLCTPQN